MHSRVRAQLPEAFMIGHGEANEDDMKTDCIQQCSTRYAVHARQASEEEEGQVAFSKRPLPENE